MFYQLYLSKAGKDEPSFGGLMYSTVTIVNSVVHLAVGNRTDVQCSHKNQNHVNYVG